MPKTAAIRPPDAPLAKYLGMLDAIGFARGVLVQGSAHGRDNSAMLDALERWPDRLRGVAVADEYAAPQTLRAWNRLGVRGLRFNHFFRDGQLHYRGGVPLSAAETLAPIMKDLGWHLQLWIDVNHLPDTIPVLKRIGLPVVIDHMGRTDARAGTGTAGFQSLLRAVGEGWCWSSWPDEELVGRPRNQIGRQNWLPRSWLTCSGVKAGMGAVMPVVGANIMLIGSLLCTGVKFGPSRT